MQQLISDMDIFLLANPTATFTDFIKWHSPKDWDHSSGNLSTRMSERGNQWIKLWERVGFWSNLGNLEDQGHRILTSECLLFLENLTFDDLRFLVRTRIQGQYLYQLNIVSAYFHNCLNDEKSDVSNNAYMLSRPFFISLEVCKKCKLIY